MESFVNIHGLGYEQREAVSFTKKILGSKAPARSILHNVTLQLELGSWVTLFGKPGTGKTTLLRLLSGVVSATAGTISINSKLPNQNPGAAAGYVGVEESEDTTDTVEDMLSTYARTHNVADAAQKIAEIANGLSMQDLLPRISSGMSTTQRLKINIARALLSDAPILLFDDVADYFDTNFMKHILGTLCQGRTVILSTRSTNVAQDMELPIMLLHDGTVKHYGTCDDIATDIACPRIIDVWLEGLRYDLLRKLRHHPGVLEVRLLTSDQFAGQRLRITLHSSRYLPSMYDAISQAELVKVEEVPPSLADIVARL